ncbi:MAG: UbiA family prenyltransferase [Acidobacteriota bacterium]|jgi:4-hydroxybenzoate polyprenyltransferase|nr:UbiA family prenyltransferase [Acidobacteriota bacterium]
MPEKRKSSLYLASLRLERWPRSLAIVIGSAATFLVNPALFPSALDPELGLKLLLAFVLTWMVSTANYIVNEITDAPFDAHHPQKKNRPLVAKEISVPVLLGVWVILTAAALGIARFTFSAAFLWSLAALLAAGLFYNVPPLRVKDIPYLDSTLESANNPIRFLVGWYVLAAEFPPLSLLVAWWAFGNFLMIGKRVAEKKFLTSEEAAGYRLSLERYSMGGLVAFMTANGLLFLAMFIVFALKTGLKTFLYALPFIVVYLVIFMFKSIQDRDAAEEPEKQLRNPFFALYTLFLLAVFVIAFLLR